MLKAYTTTPSHNASNPSSWSSTSPSSVLNTTAEIALTTRYTNIGNVYNGGNHSFMDENGNEELEYTPYGDRPETYIVPVVFLLILLIGLTGNGVLALTILRHSNMRNVPNTYVLSLAFGDLLVIVTCVPFTFTVYILDSWPFGLLLCKVSEYVKDISIGVSVFTLTALSADRFFAIVDPMRKLHATGSGRRATRFTAIVAAVIWLLAIICAIPASFSYIRVFRVNRNVSFQVCYPFPKEFGPNYPKAVLICRFFIYYVLPLSVIAVFYILMARHLMRSTRNIPGEMQGQVKQVKARKKVAKMVMAFVIVFAVCFFPQHVFMLWFYIHPTAQKDYNAFWHYFRILSFCLAFTNSCINPIALYCVSGTFRKYFDRYLLCCVPRRMRRRHRRSSDLSSRGRGQSFSLVSSRRYLSDSRREQRSVVHMSILGNDVRTTVPIKEQETTISLTVCPNGVEEVVRNERDSVQEQLTIASQLILSGTRSFIRVDAGHLPDVTCEYRRNVPEMYTNSYDDGTLMNSYIKWSKRLEELRQHTLKIHQETENMYREDEDSEDAKTETKLCSKCRDDGNGKNHSGTGFPHIQDLCPADRRRIARLIKQLIKCTKEMREAKAALAVNESEKTAMRNQYEAFLDRLRAEKKQLEFELSQSRERTIEFKTRISENFELLNQQIAEQEKQFIDLAASVSDLVREKTRLQNALAEKQTQTDALEGKLHRAREALEMEKLLRSEERNKGRVQKLDQACQTTEDGTLRIDGRKGKEDFSLRKQDSRVKGKDDLDRFSVEGAILKELFFRKPSVEESEASGIIPILSRVEYETVPSNIFL